MFWGHFYWLAKTCTTSGLTLVTAPNKNDSYKDFRSAILVQFVEFYIHIISLNKIKSVVTLFFQNVATFGGLWLWELHKTLNA